VELQGATVSALIQHQGGGETKGWSREREWKGGEGRVASGPVRRRWSEAHGSARHGGAGQRRRQLGRDRGRRKAPGGPAWAGLGHASRATVGPIQEFPKKRSWATIVCWAQTRRVVGKILSNFSNKDLILKAKD
jgi:hypothetical protein